MGFINDSERLNAAFTEPYLHPSFLDNRGKHHIKRMLPPEELAADETTHRINVFLERAKEIFMQYDGIKLDRSYSKALSIAEKHGYDLEYDLLELRLAAYNYWKEVFKKVNPNSVGKEKISLVELKRKIHETELTTLNKNNEGLVRQLAAELYSLRERESQNLSTTTPAKKVMPNIVENIKDFIRSEWLKLIITAVIAIIIGTFFCVKLGLIH